MNDMYLDPCRWCGQFCNSHFECDAICRAKKDAPIKLGDMDFLSYLREANTARQKEWTNGQVLSLSYMGNELAGEVGEACNVLKKLERESLGMVGSCATVDDLADELGDVVICVDLILARFGFSVEDVVKRKFNKTSKKNNLQTRIP